MPRAWRKQDCCPTRRSTTEQGTPRSRSSSWRRPGAGITLRGVKWRRSIRSRSRKRTTFAPPRRELACPKRIVWGEVMKVLPGRRLGQGQLGKGGRSEENLQRELVVELLLEPDQDFGGGGNR